MARETKGIVLFLLYASPLFFCIPSVFVGPYSLTPAEIVDLIGKRIICSGQSVTEQAILFDIRLPRIILALLTGCALSASSACFQATFRNPLVSEYILGISAGAAFGASLSIATLGDELPVQLMAFAGGIAAVLLTYGMARIRGETQTLSLVLAGIITNAIFTGGNYIIRYFAEPEQLHVLIVWLMGSFSAASWKDISYSGPFIIAGTLLLYLLRWRLNLLSMGDEEAKAFGVNTEKMKMVLLGTATLVTAAAISVVGIIGWIGLMVPHIVRLLIGSDNRRVLPASAAFGAALMLMADDAVRMAKGVELPVGVLTTIIGAPFFAYLIRKSRGGVWE